MRACFESKDKTIKNKQATHSLSPFQTELGEEEGIKCGLRNTEGKVSQVHLEIQTQKTVPSQKLLRWGLLKGRLPLPPMDSQCG